MKNNYKKDMRRRKLEKTNSRKHQERVIVGELLAVDPWHKPRGGYQKLVRAAIEDASDEDDYYSSN